MIADGRGRGHKQRHGLGGACQTIVDMYPLSVAENGKDAPTRVCKGGVFAEVDR